MILFGIEKVFKVINKIIVLSLTHNVTHGRYFFLKSLLEKNWNAVNNWVFKLILHHTIVRIISIQEWNLDNILEMSKISNFQVNTYLNNFSFIKKCIFWIKERAHTEAKLHPSMHKKFNSLGTVLWIITFCILIGMPLLILYQRKHTVQLNGKCFRILYIYMD